jgi:hypothetical protein
MGKEFPWSRLGVLHASGERGHAGARTRRRGGRRGVLEVATVTSAGGDATATVSQSAAPVAAAIQRPAKAATDDATAAVASAVQTPPQSTPSAPVANVTQAAKAPVATVQSVVDAAQGTVQQSVSSTPVAAASQVVTGAPDAADRVVQKAARLLRPSPQTQGASSADAGRRGSAVPLQLPQLPDKFVAMAAGAAGAASSSGVFFMLVCAALLLASWGVWRLRPGEQLRFSSLVLATPERPG